MTTTSLAHDIATAATGTQIAALSADRRARAKRCITDFLACTIAGAACEDLPLALLLAPQGDVPIPGMTDRFSAPGAALVMGTVGSFLQLHDVYTGGVSHPSSIVIPAAWAAARQVNAPTDLFLSAVVAGYETANNLARATNPRQLKMGSTPSATMGAIGAAVAAGIVLGLDVDGIAAGIGNAAFFAPLTPFQVMCEHANMSPLHSGYASRAGIEAALLAQSGWKSGRHALEGQAGVQGFFGALGGDLDVLDKAAWNGETLDAVVWKLFPCCFSNNVPIEAALGCPPLDPDDIIGGEIHIQTGGSALVAHQPRPEPELYDRLISVSWGVACALTDRRFDAQSVTRFADPRLFDLANRLKIVVDPALDIPGVMAADLRIERRSGPAIAISHRRTMRGNENGDIPPGWVTAPDSPLLDEKFAAMTAGARVEADMLRAVFG